MFKKLLLAIMIALPMSVFAQKFAVIDTNTLIAALPEVKTVNEQLESVNAKYQDEFTKLQTEFQKKFEEFQNLDPSTPQSIKDRRIQEVQELENKINQFRETASQDLARQQQQLMAPIQEKVLKAIQSIGQEGGYTFVFENMVPLYTGADVKNITDEVKARLGVN